MTDLNYLFTQRAKFIEFLETTKKSLAEIDEHIAHAINAQQIFDDADKTAGEITTKVQGFKIKLKIDKRVTWDSAGLLDVAKTMPWAEATKLFKIQFSMGEREYGALGVKAGIDDTAMSVLAKVNEAREVRFSEPKIVSIEKEG